MSYIFALSERSGRHFVQQILRALRLCARPLAPLGEGQVHGLLRAAGETEAGVRQILRGRHLEEGIPPHRTHRVSRALEMNSADPVILSKLV